MLEEGIQAPDFALSNQEGQVVRLQDFRGRWLVFWWYPEAKSEGCTVEGRAFQTRFPDFDATGAAVVGVSFNQVDKNLDFAECEGFDFPLLSDPDWAAGRAYDVVRQPDERFADKPRRITYLISPEGVIAKSYLVTDVQQHATQVLEDLSQIRAEVKKA